VAGEIIIKDAAVAGYLGPELVHRWELWSAATGVAIVLGTGWLIRRSKHKGPLEHPLIVDAPGSEEFPRSAKH
jgi:hypothetical protein